MTKKLTLNKSLGYPFKGTAFTKGQLILACQAIINGAIDRIESALPQFKDDCWESHNFKYWVRSSLETAGTALACFYASVTADGLAISDALAVSGLEETVEKWLEPYYQAAEKGRTKAKPAVSNDPHALPLATLFVEAVFGEDGFDYKFAS